MLHVQNSEFVRALRGFLDCAHGERLAATQSTPSGTAAMIATPIATPVQTPVMYGTQVANPYPASPTQPMQQIPVAMPVPAAPQAPTKAAPAAAPLPSPAFGAPALNQTTSQKRVSIVSREAPGEMFEVEIPAGVAAGQTITITVPDGRQAMLQVPAGSPPGSILTLFFDAQTGTLSPVQDSSSSTTAPRKSTSEAATTKTSADDATTVLIPVPAGVQPGQMIAVTVPDGKQINFSLPAGVQEGQMIRLWYDPVSVTLIHMP